jgi:hypothetical protein
MLEKAKNILCNEKGMETIEVIGMGVVALIAVALFFNAAKSPMDDITDKIGKGLDSVDGLTINSTEFDVEATTP